MAEYINKQQLLEKAKAHLNSPFGAALIIAEIEKTDGVEVKKIEIIRDDLKWWLETNTEKGVVYIPKYVVENMISKMDSQL